MERPRLVAVNPIDRKTRELRLSKAEVTIGSEKGNALILRESGVSRRHAVIRCQNGRYLLRDLKSTNGTFVNDRRIHATTTLNDGDHVRFAGAKFIFLDPRLAHAPKRWLSPLRAIELLLILFAIGFGLTEYLVNRESGNENLRTLTGQSAATRPTPRALATSQPETHVVHPRNTAAAAPSAKTATAPQATRASGPQPDWLKRINYFRAMVKLPALSEDPKLSEGDLLHAKYLMRNYGSVIRDGGIFGDAGHREDSDKPGYSEEGARAAKTSDVAWGCGPGTAVDEIDRWASGPFHRLSILAPDLDSAGFAKYEVNGCWAAAVRLPLHGETPRLFSTPIEFPPSNGIVTLKFEGGEWPDPLAGCPGYEPPIGLPITIQLGYNFETQLTAHSITKDGTPVENCGYGAASYTNANPDDQEYARRVLHSFAAIVLVPRKPLVPGKTYTVSVTARGQTYSWSFEAGAKGTRVSPATP